MTAKFVAGHSVGAFSAAVTAGVITLAEALAAVANLGVAHIDESGLSTRARTVLKSERWQGVGGPLTIDEDRRRA